MLINDGVLLSVDFFGGLPGVVFLELQSLNDCVAQRFFSALRVRVRMHVPLDVPLPLSSHALGYVTGFEHAPSIPPSCSRGVLDFHGLHLGEFRARGTAQMRAEAREPRREPQN